MIKVNTKALAVLLLSTSAFAGMLPDNTLTPGVTRNVTVQELCTTSTKLVRHTSQATKLAVYKEYGLVKKIDPSCTGPSHSCFEIDHRIALEDGGADDIKNLWPQEYDSKPYGAHLKDRLENEVHKRICNGQITIQQGQSIFLGDWTKSYDLYFGKP